MRQIPNILTVLRLVLTLVMFAALLAGQAGLQLVALVSFGIAAVTDFFDGWLARRWKVESLFGAILDPIADKVLVARAIVGLLASGQGELAWPGGLILFREFSVSALREVLAPRGLRLPVTFLAKTKTAIQLLGLAVMMAALIWPALLLAGLAVMWLAAVITLWTGFDYGRLAWKALKA